ncbi:hypothetical protein F5884DRAFT_748315 [Xylogone sp. PMI_703]|nr:hypothetical protein F5884DRAFT_748315 [Xylogone sp. PMI_703]
MTTATQDHINISQPPKSAPVLEFHCLFTHDLRRKHKRWQDGRLKFHTFNKRVMVYDDRSNFVGDAHWQKDYEFQEGEEFELERNGVLVQVEQCFGKTVQDLSELLEKRLKEKQDRAASRNITASGSRSIPTSSDSRNFTIPAFTSTERPKSLGAVLGQPTGHYGRAIVPASSPFEQKQRLSSSNRDENKDIRPAKRHKPSESEGSRNGYAQNLTGATLTLSRPLASQSRFQLSSFRSNIPSSSAENLDLTADEPAISKPNRFDGQADKSSELTSTVNNPKISRQLHKPIKNNYASNLTSVNLVLSQPRAPSFKNTNLKLSRRCSERQEQNQPPASKKDHDDIFIDIDEVDIGTQDAEPIEKRKHSEKKNVLMDLNERSSPVLSSKPNDQSIFESAANGLNSSGKPTTKVPRSSLRIKPRPPRKMMMLMQRSSFKSQTSTHGAESFESMNFGSKSHDIETEPILWKPTSNQKPQHSLSLHSDSEMSEAEYPTGAIDPAHADHSFDVERGESLAMHMAALDASPASFAKEKEITSSNDAPMSESHSREAHRAQNESTRDTLPTGEDAPISIRIFNDVVQKGLPASPNSTDGSSESGLAKTSHLTSNSPSRRTSSEEQSISGTVNGADKSREITPGTGTIGLDLPSLTVIREEASTMAYTMTNNGSPAASNFRAKMLQPLRDRGRDHSSNIVSQKIKVEQSTTGLTQKETPAITESVIEAVSRTQPSQQIKVSGSLVPNASDNYQERATGSPSFAPELQSINVQLKPVEAKSSVNARQAIPKFQSEQKQNLAAPSGVPPRPGLDRGGTIPTPTSATTRDTSLGPWSRESFDLFGGWKPPRTTAGQSITT